MEPLLLGLDLGTTSCKAAVVSHGGREVAHGRARVPWDRVPTGAEIDPARLVDAALAAAREALAGAPPGRVGAIGVASFAETGVLLDAHGEPVAPAIAWYDSRGAAQAERLVAELGAERFSERTGLSAAAALLAREVPLAARRARGRATRQALAERRRSGSCTGSAATRPASCRSARAPAGSTCMRATGGTRRWPGRARRRGCSASRRPRRRRPAPPATRSTGAKGAVLAVGGHDHLSAAVGAGATGEGDVLVSWGTAQAFIRAVAPLEPAAVRAAVADGINVGWHAVEGRQCLLGARRSGAALQRVLDLLGAGPDGRAELERAALEQPAAAGGIELHGLNENRVALTGIGDGVSPALVWRAALESTGRASREILEQMARVAGPHRRIVMAGGWAEGPAAQAVSEAHLGPFELSGAVYMGARGAALTAGRAAGLVS